MKLSDCYSAIARAYERDGQSTLGIAKHQVCQFFDSLPPASVVLDAGCGPGIEAVVAESYGHRVVGVDISSGMIERFKSNLPHAEAYIADISDLPFRDRRFDAIFASACLLHLPRETGMLALKGFSTLLKSFGKLWVLLTIGDGKEEVIAHRIAQEMNLDGIYFYHWAKEELKDTLSKLRFQIDSWESIKPYDNRPEIAIIQASLLPQSLDCTVGLVQGPP